MTATIPAARIEWLIDRLHVGTSDAEIEADIRRRCEISAGWTKRSINAAVKIALARHHANRDLYRTITR